MPPTITRLFIRYLPKGAKFQAAAKFSGCSLATRSAGWPRPQGPIAVSTIQMIGTSVRNTIAIRVA